MQAIAANLGSEELQQLLQEVEAVLDDDAQVSECVCGGKGCFEAMTLSTDALQQRAYWLEVHSHCSASS
jgi:hypothetical protein